MAAGLRTVASLTPVDMLLVVRRERRFRRLELLLHALLILQFSEMRTRQKGYYHQGHMWWCTPCVDYTREPELALAI